MQETLDSTPSSQSSYSGVLEAGESEVQRHLQLHSEFEASLGYMRPVLQT